MKYDPPYNKQQVIKFYGMDMYRKLSKDPAHKFRMDTGIELIHKEPSREELERIYHNWNLMTPNQKKISDKKSLELFGMTNMDHYNQLIKESYTGGNGHMSLLRENMQYLQEVEQEKENRLAKLREQAAREREEFVEDRDHILEHQEFLRRRHREYKEHVTHEMLATAIKGIYVTALERTMVMNDNLYTLAESMVEKFIEEQGGAEEILAKMQDKTYLLDTIREEVEKKAEEADEEAKEDPDQETYDEVPEDKKEELLDKMSDEQDVDNAVDLIADRIASAEEEFVKKNAEDKEKIANIVSDINDRIKAVKGDTETSEEDKEEETEELEKEGDEKVAEAYYRRFTTPFEFMVREISNDIMNDPVLKESYGGKDNFNMDAVIDATRCMYGFLETVNTLQLAKVDENYIVNVLNNL